MRTFLGLLLRLLLTVLEYVVPITVFETPPSSEEQAAKKRDAPGQDAGAEGEKAE
jgi:hypothetical protein